MWQEYTSITVMTFSTNYSIWSDWRSILEPMVPLNQVLRVINSVSKVPLTVLRTVCCNKKAIFRSNLYRYISPPYFIIIFYYYKCSGSIPSSIKCNARQFTSIRVGFHHIHCTYWESLWYANFENTEGSVFSWFYNFFNMVRMKRCFVMELDWSLREYDAG